MTATISTLLFVDPTVSDYESLIQDVDSSTKVVVLDASLQGLEQMTEALSGYANLQSIQVLSHGSPGTLKLGSDLVTTDSLGTYGDLLKGWSSALAPDADILLLGCDVAAGSGGMSFIQTLSSLTGADVAASTDLTGNIALGGDWVLEAATGEIEAGLAIAPSALNAFQGTLQNFLLVQESFRGRNVQSGPWIFGTLGTTPINPFLTARNTTNVVTGGLPGSPPAIDADGSGALRLTGLNPNQSTFVIYDRPVSAAAGLDVLFDFYSYRENANVPGADGISFFLIDGTATPTSAGGFGGSLGYANRNDILDDPNSLNDDGDGIVGGYLGIGFDEFGNFANRFDVNNGTGAVIRNGGLDQSAPDSITLRGPGSGRTGYNYITSVGLPGGASIDTPGVTSRAGAQRTARIILSTPNANGLSSLTIFIDVDGRDNAANDFVQVLTLTDLATSTGAAIPTTFKFGFAGATGGFLNIHEITTLSITTSASPPNAFDRQVEVPLGTTSVALAGDNALGAVDTNPDPAQQGIRNFVITRLPTAGVLVRGNGSVITGPLPAGGLVLGLNGAALLTYRPNDPATFAGDSFEYTAVATSGASDLTPAIVSFIAPPNALPVATNVSAEVSPSETVTIPPLSATDTDGTITSFTITSVPLLTQGVLKLGDPTGVARVVQVGDRLTPAEVSQLFFEAASDFSAATFQYTATDNKGAFSTPATVTLALPAGPCAPGIVSTITNPAGAVLIGSPGSDTLTGAAGNDTITGSLCNDVISGLGGDDQLQGGRARDTLSGGIGNDTLLGLNGIDLLQGDQGNDVIEGGEGNDTLVGAAGADTLLGQAGDDVILSGDGNDIARGSLGIDSISGGAGNDQLQGGRGNDTILGGIGDDTLLGLEDNDTLFGGDGLDSIEGGTGADTIDGEAGADFILGGSGLDLIEGGADGDTIFGGLGNDTVTGGDGDDRIVGGDPVLRGPEADFLSGEAGNDTLIGRPGDDTLSGGIGNDVLRGGQGKDTANGGVGNDSLFGRAGDDVLIGEDGDDFLDAEEGNDTLQGGAGADTLSGGLNTDSLQGGAGADSLLGGQGRDAILGGLDDDSIEGGTGFDTVDAGAGDDELRGGRGADTLTGGTGADTFVYNSPFLVDIADKSSLNALDVLTDFTPTDGDRLLIEVNREVSPPSRLSDAGVIQATTLEQAAILVFADKNQTLPDAQPLKAGQASFFSWNSSTYLVVNSRGTSTFVADENLLINVGALVIDPASAPGGILNIADYFVVPPTV